MANIADYLSQLQTLTQKNLELLTAINNSFFTKREHLQVQMGETQYVIPSFISLENKINSLQENFENLINAPKTGEAIFNIDGNSRSIEVKGYTNTPEKISIDVSKISGFGVENNDVFKDFLTPVPYLKIDLSGLSNDVSCVNVRKIAFTSETLKNVISELITTNQGVLCSYNWSDLYKILSIYSEDKDYVLYDTLRRLPLRKNMGYGVYTIKSIDSDSIDDDLEETYTLTLHEDLKYTLYDETTDMYLQNGDYLVTYDDSAKMQITYIDFSSNQIKVKVVNGDYLNLAEDPENTLSSDMCKLKFFSSVNYESNKYINIPLEEDRYIAVFVAPTNDRMNIQAPWGSGIIVDTNSLVAESDNSINFKTYYENNVRNIGDILNEITSSMNATIMRYNEDEFNNFSTYKPTVNTDKLKVVQINSHLNNSTTVQNIRSLYSQKQEYNRQLQEVQEQITSINSTLSEISFADTTGVRAAYESQLTQYNTRQNDLLTSLTKICNEIATAANDSVIPIENAKYRIRGYFDWNITDSSVDQVLSQYKDHVKGIRVQYRYKNQDATTGTALSIDDKFVFSDWNDMNSFDLMKKPSYDEGYKFQYTQYDGSQDNGKQNEPSFNQIDIPISQGETVDIRLKIVWDFGFPFIESTSDWSDVVNIVFPDEYLKDVQITDILEENNNDIENNRFKNILEDQGVTSHIGDSIVDQNITYFHQPDHIASGFYTDERRIIPLRDKLASLDTAIQTIQDLVQGTNSNNLTVTVTVDGTDNIINTGTSNNIMLPAYTNTSSSSDRSVYSIQATIQITNNSSHIAYLYSIFPSNNTGDITSKSKSKYTATDYVDSNNHGVAFGYPSIAGDGSINSKIQQTNQWLTFRIKNDYDGSLYYVTASKDDAVDDKLSYYNISSEITNNMNIYPYLAKETSLQIDNANLYSYLSLAPGESVVVPLMIHYHFGEDKKQNSYSKIIAFDLRTSLYLDPTTYIIRFVAPYEDTVQDKISRSESRLINNTSSDGVTKYQSTIKN